MATNQGDRGDTANGGWKERYRNKWRWDKAYWATHCVDCYPGACPLHVYVRDGKVLAQETAGAFPMIEPGVPDMNPMGCQKGVAWHQLLDSPERVLHPLKRAGERGQGKWEEISWDQALTEIADHMLDAIQEMGPESIINEGTPGEGGLLGGMPVQRVVEMVGGLHTDVNAVINDFSPGLYLTFGKFNPTSGMGNRFHSRFVMMTHSNPIYTQIAGYHFTAEARYNGAEVVLVAPDCSPSHIHADYHVPIKPGADAALGLGMASVIIAEGLADLDFVREQTDLPLLVRRDTQQFLVQSALSPGGREDQFYFWDEVTGALVEAPRATLALGDVRPVLEGVFLVELQGSKRVEVVPVFELLKERLADYTPEKASEMCGVNPDTIRMLARKIASVRGAIASGGTSFKYYHADLMIRSYMLVLALTGNWGRKGTGPVEWSIAGFDGPLLFNGKQKKGLEETRRILAMREAVLDMLQAEDPTRTEEMLGIEMMAKMAPQGSMVPPAFLWYYHCGYSDNWNRREWGDPTMQRPFDEYLEESLDREWWEGMARPGPDTVPRVYFEVGGNALRRTRGGQNQLLPNFWPKLRCIVTVDWRMNTTGLFSDYFLPVAQHYEKVNFQFSTPSVMHLVFSDKAVEPPPDVKSEFDIGLMLAEKLEAQAKKREILESRDSRGVLRRLDNLLDRFTAGGAFNTDESVAREWVQDSVEVGNIPEGTTLESLKDDGFVRITGWGISPIALNEAADIKDDETLTGLTWHVEKKLPYPTFTRRAQFYIDHEWFIEAGEQLPCHKENPGQGGDYPFVMTSGHNRWSVHSMNIVNRTIQQTHRGEPHVVMNPEDVLRLGVENGEVVDVHNDMGSFLAPVKVSPSVRPGQVVSYNGWEPYMYRTWKGASDLEPGMVKWLHFAGGRGHLRYWPIQWQPVPFDRGISVGVSKID